MIQKSFKVFGIKFYIYLPLAFGKRRINWNDVPKIYLCIVISKGKQLYLMDAIIS
jgi:hypothetical protein